MEQVRTYLFPVTDLRLKVYILQKEGEYMTHKMEN